MGKYVYLEDEEIEKLQASLEVFTCLTDESIKITNNILDKLSQKPKTIEDIGFNKVSERKEPFMMCFSNNNTHENVVFSEKDIMLGSEEWSIDELEAILNKAKELFNGVDKR